MIIRGNRCVLRPFNICDSGAFYNMVKDDELVERFVPYAYQKDIEEADDTVYNCYSKGDLKNDFYLVIECEGEEVGCIVAVRTIGKCLDVSALLAKAHRGKGLMTDAMLAFMKWLRINTDYSELEMKINTENEASIRQIKKIGGVFIKTVTEKTGATEQNEEGKSSKQETYEIYKVYLR